MTEIKNPIVITKTGIAFLGIVILVGFILVSGISYNTSLIVKNQAPVVITKTIVVTPTVEPSATPSASVTRISVPARITKPLTK